MSSKVYREAYLRPLGIIYLAAFVSYWIQFDGLLGIDGLEPVESHFSRENLVH